MALSNKNHKTKSVRQIVDEVYGTDHFARLRFPDPLKNITTNRRPLSAGVFGMAEGDEGKGIGILRINIDLKKRAGKLYSFRTGGGGNAGHDVTFDSGKKFTFSQIPVASALEGAVAICGRAMFLHPGDILQEIAAIKKTFGGLPGKILIDSHASLALDTLRALESAIDQYNPKERMSVGRAMSPTEAFRVMKIGLTMEDLMSTDWRTKLSRHYEFLQKLLSGLGYDLAEMEVATYSGPNRIKVGPKDDFLERLADARGKLRPYVSDSIYEIINKVWRDVSIPVTFEAQQGFGLHPYFGIDYTSTDPGPRGITITTDGLVCPNEVGGIFSMIKAPWMSSSGRRIFPGGQLSLRIANPIRKIFHEVGRIDPVPRDIFPSQLPLYQLASRIDRPDYLYFTHMDASLDKIYVAVAYYTRGDRSKKPQPYRPYQKYLDKLEADIVELPGWDGKVASRAESPEELPANALRLMEFYSQCLATPPGYASIGEYPRQIVSWFN